MRPREYQEKDEAAQAKKRKFSSAKAKSQTSTRRNPGLYNKLATGEFDLISTGPNVYGLPWIPWELQRQIIKSGVTTHLPFIDYGFPTQDFFRKKENERRGQDDVNGKIMLCCKLYYQEGIKPFWRDNTFLYIGRYIVDRLVPESGYRPNEWVWRRHLDKERHQLDKETVWSFSSQMVTTKRGFGCLRHMDLRLDISRYPQHQMKSIIAAMSFAFKYPNVETLCLQLAPRGAIETVRGGEEWFNEARDLVREVINGDSYWKSHNDNYSADLDGSNGGQLTEFHLRGVPKDNISLLCIVCASLLVRADGRMGLDLWNEEKLSAVRGDGKESHIRGYEDNINYWLEKKDLREWVWEECQDYIDDDTVFDWRAFFAVPGEGIIVAED